ncbi:MAG TPA: hypothetical protein VFV34_22530, partial [Blastocatellia bacterium]|nr:hypothetical protein [Blastocatellia bacterium]
SGMRTRSAPDVDILQTKSSGSPVPNPRAVLESVLKKMSQARAVRTRMLTALPSGERLLKIESVKPDRVHIIAPDGEMIIIGRKLYSTFGQGTWQVTPLPAGGGSEAGAFDFQAFIREMMSKTGVSITGQILGDETVDEVEAVAYEFTVTDGKETGVMQVSVGKQDGYMRRLFLLGDAISLKIWFSDINGDLSIEAPI